MPTIHTGLHTHSQPIHTAANREVTIHRPSFTQGESVNAQVQKDLSQPIHALSRSIHGPLARVMNSSPEGGFITAGLRDRLTGTNVAKAGQILAILQRVSSRVETSDAERFLRQAMEGPHDPKEVLAELLTVAASCRGEKTLTGVPLHECAKSVMATSTSVGGGA